jgi:7,8-dihydropterin-6-yl-methyl-4-(beta-D-ribofuranosyl)aminobenzene 5'-phosphate synthase
MNASLNVTLLAENTAEGRGIRGEHGLAFWIERDGQRILFDTGQGLVLADNAKRLDVELAAADALVLSHGHYDHTGGVAQVLAAVNRELPVYAHPAALEAKYHAAGSGVREIGMPAACRQALETQAQLILSTTGSTIAEGIRTSGEIPRIHPEEISDEHFCLDAAGQVVDPIADDQALIVGTGSGVVVLLGCAHAGLVNTLDHVRELTNGAPIRAVVGGMHLRNATPERLEWTVRELQRFNIARLYPMHCTGFAAAATLWKALPGRVQVAGAGTTLTFD